MKENNLMLLIALPILYAVANMRLLLTVCAPSNVLMRHLRSGRPRWRAALVALGVSAALLLAMHGFTPAAAAGATWLNAVILVLAWDALKLALLGVELAMHSVVGAVFARGTPTRRG